MSGFVCNSCEIPFTGDLNVPITELICRICGDKEFRFELDEDDWDKKEEKNIKMKKVIGAFSIILIICIILWVV